MKSLLRSDWLWPIFIASMLGGAYQLWQLSTLHEQNGWIERYAAGQDAAVGSLAAAVPELGLARAYYLKQKRRYDEALGALNPVMQQGDRSFQSRLRYLLGNIYLEQAVQKTEQGAFNEALALAVLAKQAYRQALHFESGFWDAKYNLEVAMRLLPEMERINSGDETLPNQKTQLWTTVPGFPRGLP